MNFFCAFPKAKFERFETDRETDRQFVDKRTLILSQGINRARQGNTDAPHPHPTTTRTHEQKLITPCIVAVCHGKRVAQLGDFALPPSWFGLGGSNSQWLPGLSRLTAVCFRWVSAGGMFDTIQQLADLRASMVSCSSFPNDALPHGDLRAARCRCASAVWTALCLPAP